MNVFQNRDDALAAMARVWDAEVALRNLGPARRAAEIAADIGGPLGLLATLDAIAGDLDDYESKWGKLPRAEG